MLRRSLIPAVIVIFATTGWFLLADGDDEKHSESGPWFPSAAIGPGFGKSPTDWRDVQAFAIKMESGACVGDTERLPKPDRITVEETEKTVTVTAFADVSELGTGYCDGVGYVLDAGIVTLDRPLGERRLLDGSYSPPVVVGPKPTAAWRGLLPRGSKHGVFPQPSS